jgi:hypothetical protein
MKDFAVWYQGKVIDYVKSATLRKATNLAKKIWGDQVTVTEV